jgi:hypothetical protein
LAPEIGEVMEDKMEKALERKGKFGSIAREVMKKKDKEN